MNKQERKSIIKLQNTLIKIDAQIPVFFNITLYKNLGLVREIMCNKKDGYGNTHKVVKRWVLTEKAKQYIKTGV